MRVLNTDPRQLVCRLLPNRPICGRVIVQQAVATLTTELDAAASEVGRGQAALRKAERDMELVKAGTAAAVEASRQAALGQCSAELEELRAVATSLRSDLDAATAALRTKDGVLDSMAEQVTRMSSEIAQLRAAAAAVGALASVGAGGRPLSRPGSSLGPGEASEEDAPLPALLLPPAPPPAPHMLTLSGGPMGGASGLHSLDLLYAMGGGMAPLAVPPLAVSMTSPMPDAEMTPAMHVMQDERCVVLRDVLGDRCSGGGGLMGEAGRNIRQLVADVRVLFLQQLCGGALWLVFSTPFSLSPPPRLRW